MPYALSLSGWVGLLSLASVVSIFCVAAHFIVHAFDRLPADCPRTYPDLGERGASMQRPLPREGCCCAALSAGWPGVSVDQALAWPSASRPANTQTRHAFPALQDLLHSAEQGGGWWLCLHSGSCLGPRAL